MSEAEARRVRDQFLNRYRADLEAGAIADLAAYQALFAGFEADIAAEYALLEDEGEVAGPDDDALARDPALETFGPYRLLGELGRGGQAVVFAAEDRRLGRRVALKLLRAGALSFTSTDDRRRFRREAELAAQLDHPGICSVFEAGEHDGTSFIAMRLIEGEPLSNQIARQRERAAASSSTSTRRQDIERLLRIGESCARALHFAHEHGLVHRDVKPGNVMITAADEPVLLDFGLAHTTGDDHTLTASGSAVGTPYYMAPEQVRGDLHAIDARTDVYSLGVTLYEAFTGARPFEAATREVLYRQVLLREPRAARAIDPTLPRDLEVVLATAMQKEPDRRYRSAEALAEDLTRVRRREPILARPAGPLSRGWSWARRRPAVASLLALVLAITVVGVAMLERSRAALQEKVAELTRLADLRELQLLRERLTKLPAFRSEHAPALAEWITDAEALVGREPLHVATRARLRERDDVQSNAVQWQLHALDDLIANIDRFEAKELQLGRQRLDHVTNVERRSLEDHTDAWTRAISTIADPHRSPAYRGLALKPQLGLAPLGADPDSGLEEFAHLASGVPPVRDDAGHLHIGDDTGIVFVLLPGGSFEMGAARPGDAHPLGSPNVDPWALDPEGPPHEVTLAPFLMSKYEVTQGQWARLCGDYPSQLGPRPGSSPQLTLAHPVDTVSHNRCREVLAVHGLVLPTEAQWEYAARGGTGTVWWCGNDPRALDRFANLQDRTNLEATHHFAVADALEQALDDGYPYTAPVGSFPANPFGLHDVIGNVGELVAGDPLYYSNPARPGDGLLLETDGSLPNGERQMVRGGDWGSRPEQARSACRAHVTPDTAVIEIGVRAARGIDP